MVNVKNFSEDYPKGRNVNSDTPGLTFALFISMVAVARGFMGIHSAIQRAGILSGEVAMIDANSLSAAGSRRSRFREQGQARAASPPRTIPIAIIAAKDFRENRGNGE